MRPLNQDKFKAWLEVHGNASVENELQASAELFARNAKYYETPFDGPMIGPDAIRKYREMGAKAFKDKECTYEMFSVKDNIGIARWQSKFTDKRSYKRFTLDCLFLVEFDENDKCRLFREWWHLQEVRANWESTS